MNRFSNYNIQKQPFNTAEETFFRLIPWVKTFKIATITGFQILHLGQIVYFEFTKKEWHIYLSDHADMQLKSKTTSRDILNYSESFAQINHHQLINISFLSTINGNECVLIPPFENKGSFKISRKYRESLLEKFCSI